MSIFTISIAEGEGIEKLSNGQRVLFALFYTPSYFASLCPFPTNTCH